MNENVQVAETIREQIGRKAFFMLGAKDYVSVDGKALQFKIGRNSKGVTHVRVALMPDDTYMVTFYRFWGLKMTIKNEFANVHVDSLHTIIETGTGMYVNL